MVDACATIAGRPLDAAAKADVRARLEAWGNEGFRVLGVATRTCAPRAWSRADEVDLDLVGYLVFFDPPRPDAAEAVESLQRLGVALKIITGDQRLVAEHVARAIGLEIEGVLTGADLEKMSDEALWHRAEKTTVFAEVDPNEKERIILAIRKTGHIVGYMGDGINDAPALHAADVAISVDTAVDVAREAADFVLLEPGLDVLRRAIESGRSTFANTLKYVWTTESANLGNMVSMAAASLFLPFLPLLAKQILLNNFLSDFPAVAIATDNVDEELVDRPQRWDIVGLRRFMLVFGLVSAAFDGVTFAVLLGLHAPVDEFRTAWFVESLLSELAVALSVRTRRPMWKSTPGKQLLWSSIGVAVVSCALPWSPVAGWLGFVALPWTLAVAILAIVGTYVLAVEVAKRWFWRRV